VLRDHVEVCRPGKDAVARPLSVRSHRAPSRCGRVAGHRSSRARSSRCTSCESWPASGDRRLRSRRPRRRSSARSGSRPRSSAGSGMT
jgi:hypothetical protein